MKINVSKPNNYVISSQTQSSSNFSIDSKNFSYITKLLSKSLYSNPIRTLMTEYVQNALDSHIISNQNKKVIVTIPTIDYPYYEVQDFGKGMSPDFVLNQLTKYGTSTKTNDNIQSGGFGIGFKASAIYCDNFQMIVNYNNIKYYYDIVNHEGSGSITLISQSPTDEINGVTIRIKIEDNDIENFKIQAPYLYTMLSDRITCIFKNKKGEFIEELPIGFDKKDIHTRIDNSYVVAKTTFHGVNSVSLYSNNIFITNFTSDDIFEMYKILNTEGSVYIQNIDDIINTLNNCEFVEYFAKYNRHDLYYGRYTSMLINVSGDEAELSVNRESFIKTNKFYCVIAQKIANIIKGIKQKDENTIRMLDSCTNICEFNDIINRLFMICKYNDIIYQKCIDIIEKQCRFSNSYESKHLSTSLSYSGRFVNDVINYKYQETTQNIDELKDCFIIDCECDNAIEKFKRRSAAFKYIDLFSINKIVILNKSRSILSSKIKELLCDITNKILFIENKFENNDKLNTFIQYLSFIFKNIPIQVIGSCDRKKPSTNKLKTIKLAITTNKRGLNFNNTPIPKTISNLNEITPVIYISDEIYETYDEGAIYEHIMERYVPAFFKIQEKYKHFELYIPSDFWIIPYLFDSPYKNILILPDSYAVEAKNQSILDSTNINKSFKNSNDFILQLLNDKRFFDLQLIHCSGDDKSSILQLIFNNQGLSLNAIKDITRLIDYIFDTSYRNYIDMYNNIKFDSCDSPYDVFGVKILKQLTNHIEHILSDDIAEEYKKTNLYKNPNTLSKILNMFPYFYNNYIYENLWQFISKLTKYKPEQITKIVDTLISL